MDAFPIACALAVIIGSSGLVVLAVECIRYAIRKRS